MDRNMIALCGLNCAVCSEALREDSPCVGCRSEGNKGEYCANLCKIVKCEIRKSLPDGFCDKCHLDITSMEHSDMMRMRGVFQDENCLVFGVSISGEKEEVLYLLEEAHKRGARTVMLTARNRPDFDAFCDEVVLLPSLLHLNHGNVISPQFPILLLTDILYSYYLSQDQYKKEVLHDSTLRALEKGRRENNVL